MKSELVRPVIKMARTQETSLWNPEQLSTVHGMEEKFVMILGCHGTGKTTMLFERAEYVLRKNEDAKCKIYFEDKQIGSGFHRNLKLKLERHPRAQFKSWNRIFEFDYEKEDINKDHLFIDNIS